MTAVEALRAARSAKVHIGLDGNDLVLRAPAPPPPALIDALKRHKPGIVQECRQIDMKFATLTRMADNVMIYKYVPGSPENRGSRIHQSRSRR